MNEKLVQAEAQMDEAVNGMTYLGVKIVEWFEAHNTPETREILKLVDDLSEHFSKFVDGACDLHDRLVELGEFKSE